MYLDGNSKVGSAEVYKCPLCRDGRSLEQFNEEIGRLNYACEITYQRLLKLENLLRDRCVCDSELVCEFCKMRQEVNEIGSYGYGKVQDDNNG